MSCQGCEQLARLVRSLEVDLAFAKGQLEALDKALTQAEQLAQERLDEITNAYKLVVKAYE